MHRRPLISDANILIDMNTGGLLGPMFRLGMTFAVPNTLFEEELRDHHPDLARLGLKSPELRGDAVEYADRLVTQHLSGHCSVSGHCRSGIDTRRNSDPAIRELA